MPKIKNRTLNAGKDVEELLSYISGRNVTVDVVLRPRQVPYLHHSSTSFDNQTGDFS